MVLARVVDEHRRRVCLGRAIDQVLVQERAQHLGTELARGVAFENQRTQGAAVVVHLAVAPRAHHQVVEGIALVARLHRRIAVDRTPHVFLIPQALQPHRGHLQRRARHHLVQRLFLPERVIGGVFGELVPPRQLLQACSLGEVAGRAGLQEIAVVVVPLARDTGALAALAQLAGEVIEIDLAERAVIEPVVAHPAVDHRAFWHRHLQGGMRVGQRHHHGESFVGRTDHTDLAIGFLDILHQPVDGVPGIGGMVDLAGIERPTQRARHHVIAFGTVLAAHVLKHTDVAAFHEDVVAGRQQVLHMRRVQPFGAATGIVRRARQHDRRVPSALRQHDHRVQLDPIAHRNHHLALDVVVARIGSHERLAGDVRRHRRGLRPGAAGGGGNGGGEQAGGKAAHGISGSNGGQDEQLQQRRHRQLACGSVEGTGSATLRRARAADRLQGSALVVS